MNAQRHGKDTRQSIHDFTYIKSYNDQYNTVRGGTTIAAKIFAIITFFAAIYFYWLTFFSFAFDALRHGFALTRKIIYMLLIVLTTLVVSFMLHYSIMYNHGALYTQPDGTDIIATLQNTDPNTFRNICVDSAFEYTVIGIFAILAAAFIIRICTRGMDRVDLEEDEMKIRYELVLKSANRKKRFWHCLLSPMILLGFHRNVVCEYPQYKNGKKKVALDGCSFGLLNYNGCSYYVEKQDVSTHGFAAIDLGTDLQSASANAATQPINNIKNSPVENPYKPTILEGEQALDELYKIARGNPEAEKMLDKLKNGK